MNRNIVGFEEITKISEKEYIDDEKELPFATKDKIGRIIDYSAGRNRYIGYLISLATRSFEGKRILHDISTTFYAGKTNLIIGQSGSGKTVLMKSIVGLLRPDSGEILYDGRDFLKYNSSELKGLRAEIGMLFQGSALFDSMTVIENVMFPLLMFTNPRWNQNFENVHPLAHSDWAISFSWWGKIKS